ncbi:NifU family protein [Flavobacterium ardleyense]|uniref:NifU family protein n=1 Tax=Flavobacterium ardleyense TaxID=2038737 RepID=UPI00298C4189|nr:NifU family protein [Flavobacterium ardleyense]
MTILKIVETQNPTIIKFEFPDFIVTQGNYEYKNIDDAKNSPLAQQLFHLPFVKTIYISGKFIAIERYSIVEWIDVQEAVAEQIQDYVNNGGEIIAVQTPTIGKKAITVYGEMTPNPSALKFVVNIMLTKTSADFKSIDDTAPSPLAKVLFNFPYVKEIYIHENYISITKYDIYEWSDITLELRTFIKEFLENGGLAIDEALIVATPEQQKQQITNFDTLDTTSQKIINILEEYVKPAVAADGGNILFQSYDPVEKRVKVVMQGACNGCPSSTFTLKSGIENMLKDMLNDNDIKVEAVAG